ncbi:unnamed protein product [Cyprideis torosa]|uniref:Uncharacterized protein n=1 Tax=Cyprideis torosa TaxID=163714 RepID=A0A7R8ZMZ4_9CRUS|nr:unnamed protein product [Cyprideis torosa]CAG0886708.1 unnamed protein product [Cyprideis torosa]
MEGLYSHMLPGMTFIIAAFWWLGNGLEKYKESQKSGISHGYESLASYPGIPFTKKKFSKLQFEGFMAIFVFTVLILETFAGIDTEDELYWFKTRSLQRIVFLLCLLFRCCVTLMTFYSDVLPRETDFAVTALVMFLQVPFFLAEIYGKSNNAIVTYGLPALLMYAAGKFVLNEMNDRSDVIQTIGKCYVTALAGIWLIHSGGVLLEIEPFRSYHMAYDMHAQVFYLSIYFTLDAMVLAILFTFLAARRLSGVFEHETPEKYYVNVD